MNKTCIFCDGRVDSKEDIWPKWVLRLLKKNHDERVPMRAQRYKEQPKEWPTKDSALKIGNVCQESNNGWMSRLEDQVKPILTPMILGNPVIVTPAQQQRVTAWLTKGAMMFDSMDKGEVFYDVLDRQHFRKYVAPYSDTAAWLGHYVGNMGRAFADHRTLHTKFASGGSVKTHVLTMSMGQVVLQVVSIKRLEYLDLAPRTDLQTNGPPLNDALVQIWPLSFQEISWPPSVSFNDKERHLRFFAYRFGGDKV
jgi:hypothetical protein